MPTQFTQGIRFEVAQDVLGALIAHWAEAAAQAFDAANPILAGWPRSRPSSANYETSVPTSTPATPRKSSP